MHLKSSFIYYRQLYTAAQTVCVDLIMWRNPLTVCVFPIFWHIYDRITCPEIESLGIAPKLRWLSENRHSVGIVHSEHNPRSCGEPA